MSKFSFSVILAVYNGEKTLSRAIESVLAQTLPPEEIIVIDDGSTDNTFAIASSYGWPVKVWRQSNRGAAAARNVGVQMAQGEWIAFLDADDYYYPERLALTAKLVETYPNVDFVTSDFDYRDQEGNLLRRSLESTQLGRRLLGQGDELYALMQQRDLGDFIEDHFGDTHTLTVPRRTFLKLGGYPEQFAVCEDVHFLIRLCLQSRLAGVIKQPLAAYVIHDKSATRSDPLRAQRQTVAAWCSLKPLIARGSPEIRAGFRRGLRRARFNLAVAQLKAGKRLAALQAVLPLIYEDPSWESVKTIASVIKG